MENYKNKDCAAVLLFWTAIKNFAAGVVNDFKEAQRDLDAVREKMNQRSK